MVYELDLNFYNYKKKKKSTKSLDSFTFISETSRAGENRHIYTHSTHNA